MSILRQTYFLLKKNFQIKKRHKKLTAQEIIVPIYWLLILVIIKKTTKSNVEPPIDSSKLPIQTLGQGMQHASNTTNLIAIVTNGDSLCEQVFSEFKKATGPSTTYKKFNSSEDMVKYYREFGESTRMGIGLVFKKDKQYGVSYTMHVADGIIPTSKVIDTGKCRNLKSKFYYNCPAYKYINNNIAYLQTGIDSAISKVLAGLPYYIVPNITVQMMPKGEFVPPNALATTVPIYMVLSFAPYITILLVNLVDEKEKKQKELLRIMGMYDTAYWLSWFLTYAIIMFFACIIINAIAIPTGIFGNSNFLVMLIVFYLFSLSLIVFAFMLTPLFKKAMTAGIVANLTTICFGVLIIPLGLPNVPRFGYWLGCLLSPTAFGLVLREAVDTTGLHFNNLATKGTFAPAYAISMIVVDIFLYLLLALYLDAVIPAEYGKRRPPYFIFQLSFWKSVFCADENQPRNNEMQRQISARGTENMNDVEPVGEEMVGKEAISIHKLRKVFPGKEGVVAVDDFSMDIYEGQVTALLGHNGAGKSTLIAALTGMTMPSSGSALIYGMDITDPDQMTQIRRNIGVCPQQDVIFDFITVREHLELYAGLKGVPSDERQTMADSVIKDIGLEDKEDDIAKNLSGGQKRKLCVGISLMGNPKVLFLDEPTSGMDPFSRRSMWSLLQEQAKDKVVVLTTHFMDEADILADYKAIMSKGKLRCAGSSLYLKNRFGIGYHLTMAISEECDHEGLERLVKSQVEGAEVLRHHGRELAFALPIEQVGKFSALFKTLEENNDSDQACAASRLGVSSYGVSMTTLEEVFLQLEDTMDKDDADKDDSDKDEDNKPLTAQTMAGSLDVLVANGKGSNSGNLHHTGAELDTIDNVKLTGMQKSLGQLMGLLKINWLNTIRSPLKIFFMIVLPPVFLIIGLVLMGNSSTSNKYDLSPIKITPALYLKPESKENIAAPLLFQNSTGGSVNDMLGFLKDYKVDVDLVKSLDTYLKSSPGVKPFWGLGLKALSFPRVKNMSANPNLMSSFLLRFNDSMPHSIPVGINLISSLFNMYVLQAQNKTPHPIMTSFQEFPNLKPKWSYDNSAFVAVLLIGLGFVLFPGSFAILIVAQRQMGVRHLLRVSGVSSIIYWLYLFISDSILFILPTIIMLIVIPAVGVASLSSGAAMGCLVLVVVMYIPTGTLFSYCLSFLFDKWETCQQVTPSVFTYAGIIPFVAVSLIDMLGNPDTAIIIHYLFCFIDPVYSLVGALYYITRIHLIASLKAQSDDVTIAASEYFTWTKHNGIPAALLAMAIHTIIFGFLLYYLDNRHTGGNEHKLPCHKKRAIARSTSPSSHITAQEDDVRAEKEKIASTDLSDPQNSYSVAVKGLWKKFKEGKKQKVVVKDLYFGVQPGEVFGLLGPNGAGKTTTLNIITGAINPTRGQMAVSGYDMSTQSNEIFQRMGYCPQTDALWPDITLEENLICFARVRGIPAKDVKRIVNYYMSAMKVTEHAKKSSKALSGGTKRKVSFLIAMLGSPELLLLDEPSTGLDPSARRFLWNTISKNVCGNRGAILTTHSMEEADALSSRVGIMVKGEMKCLGSTQHLKSKYGSGYSLEIKLTQGSHAQSSLEDYVRELFPGATLNETFGGKSTYKVPNDNVSKLSSIFAKLEEGKQTIGIEEYSFSQSTLEQVFLEFAREQDEDRTGEKDDQQEIPPEDGPQMA